LESKSGEKREVEIVANRYDEDGTQRGTVWFCQKSATIGQINTSDIDEPGGGDDVYRGPAASGDCSARFIKSQIRGLFPPIR
jgi:hypothetical protein